MEVGGGVRFFRESRKVDLVSDSFVVVYISGRLEFRLGGIRLVHIRSV